MTTVAERARNAAFDFECKKDGLGQLSKTGEWVLRIKIAFGELPDQISKAPMGQRFKVAFVEIDDMEEPINRTNSTGSAAVVMPPAAEPAQTGRPAPVEESRVSKRSWNELPPQTQAAIVGAEPVFWKFAYEKHGWCVNDKEGAAEFIRNSCGVDTRKQLETNSFAQGLWLDLYNEFRAWLDHPELADAR